MAYSDQVIANESGGDPNSQSTTSSASGPAGFINSTFLDVARQMRPELANRPDAEVLALKSDPDFSRQATDYYAQQNQAVLSKAGLPVTDGSTYLAHFAGPTGAVKILQADPNASVESILGAKVVAANPFLQGMTAQGLQAWAAKKMGVQAPQPGMQNSPSASPASPPSVPLNIAPPIFPAAQAPPADQPRPQDAAPPAFAQIPEQQAPPIFFAPRPRVNLTNLRNAFHAPVFPRG